MDRKNKKEITADLSMLRCPHANRAHAHPCDGADNTNKANIKTRDTLAHVTTQQQTEIVTQPKQAEVNARTKNV